VSRIVCLDKDGTLVEDVPYNVDPSLLRFTPHAFEALRLWRDAGYRLVVVTNQSGIGRGMYSEEDFGVLTTWMKGRFASAGAPLAGVYFCPHHPVDAHGAYRIACDCRKPAPGMLLRAARELHVDLARSALFGDTRHDLEAAAAARVPARILLGTNGTQPPADIESPLCGARFRSLAEAVSSAALWTLLGEASHA
jgi:D-glycero-D-manno-heptose 1,7-bisphosphate phosphatase